MKYLDDINDYNYKPRDPTVDGFNHSEPESDDTGLPEHPIYRNIRFTPTMLNIFGKYIGDKDLYNPRTDHI